MGGQRLCVEDIVRIEIKIRQIDLGDTMDDLIEQMGHYSSRMVGDGITCLMGDKFNVYLHPTTERPALSHELRLIEIYPKDTPL